MMDAEIYLGIAGNFTDHLKQAGELADFANIKTAEADAPKGLFPFFVPNAKNFLGINPLSHDKINLLPGQTLQVEPEIALLCQLQYTDKKISAVTPTHFTAFNDCSIRQTDAPKISLKKNWGPSSKGLAKEWLPYEEINEYRLCSHLKRDDQLIQYGEDSALKDYSYFGEKLLNWIKNQLNTQKDEGPLEDLPTLIELSNYPKTALIAIGATRYTEIGETTFLQKNDEIFITTYNGPKKITLHQIVVVGDL